MEIHGLADESLAVADFLAFGAAKSTRWPFRKMLLQGLYLPGSGMQLRTAINPAHTYLFR